jgi:hypothetical protein
MSDCKVLDTEHHCIWSDNKAIVTGLKDILRIAKFNNQLISVQVLSGAIEIIKSQEQRIKELEERTVRLESFIRKTIEKWEGVEELEPTLLLLRQVLRSDV